MNAERILRQHFEDLQRAGVTHASSGLVELVNELLESRSTNPDDQSVAADTPAQQEPSTSAKTIPRLGSKRPNQPATESPSIRPVASPRTNPQTSTSTGSHSPANNPTSPPVSSPPISPPPASAIDPNRVIDLDGRINELAGVAQRVAACQKCSELVSGRTQTVFGVGNPDAEIMFIGEAPGADEDRQGEPFVGAAGQLLNKIITACLLTREEIYICNILRCRPPGNRNPTPEEAQNCREFLDAQIQLVQPKYIVCWGSIAAQNLLNSKTTIGRMRGKFFDYNGIKVACTYHPSYLLRNPSAKKMVWDDLKFVRADMGVELA
jgi:uracil-DNA glycosylase